SLLDKAVAASAIIAWSGLSVHAQVAAMVHGTDIRLWPYVSARALHALLAAAFTWLILGPGRGLSNMALLPAMAPMWATGSLTFAARLFHATATATQLALVPLAALAAGAAVRRLALFWARIR
ncbi:MAG: hypothetical protein H0Z37_08630, partial [Firmicutes bacterium]|nr:hypothetical protein [Bacillota bacterium]